MPSRAAGRGPAGIRLEGVTKRYGTVRAVDNLDLEIRPGELFVLIGPSGSGKTTMLRMVNRLAEPDEGRVCIDGQDVRVHDPVALRRNTGYVIQHIGLFPHLTVAGNIGIVPGLDGMDVGLLEERVRHLLSLVMLPPEVFMDRYPRELAGGQQQRVGLARALVMDPPLLLMDEPFGALDPVLRHQLQEEFLAIRSQVNKTILFVTHDIEEAFRLGDRAGIVMNGGLVQVRTPEELIMLPYSPDVRTLIGAGQKMRYLNHLPVGSLWVPVDPAFLLDGDGLAGDACRALASAGRDYALVQRSGAPEGIVYLRDLIGPGGRDVPLIQKTRRLTAVDPSMPASEALSLMKQRQETVALVHDGTGIRGIFLMDEMVRRLL